MTLMPWAMILARERLARAGRVRFRICILDYLRLAIHCDCKADSVGDIARGGVIGHVFIADDPNACEIAEEHHMRAALVSSSDKPELVALNDSTRRSTAMRA